MRNLSFLRRGLFNQSKIARAVASNMGGQAIQVVIILGTTSILLGNWSVSTYAMWILMSTIPTYLSLGDGGVVAAVSNKVTEAIAAADDQGAHQIWADGKKAVKLIGCVLIALALSAGLLLFATLENSMWLCLPLLSLNTLNAWFGGLEEATFRAMGRYATGNLLGFLARLLEAIGYVSVSFLTSNFIWVAAGGVVGRLLGLGVLRRLRLQLWMSPRVPPLRGTLSGARVLLRQGLGFLGFAIASAMALQSITLLAGAFCSAVALAWFVNVRSVVRINTQATAVISYAIWPTLSQMKGTGDAAGFSALTRRAKSSTLALNVGFALVLVALGPSFLKHWTHGHLTASTMSLILPALYGFLASLWHIDGVRLRAINQASHLARLCIVVYLLSIPVTALLCWQFDVNGLFLGMALSEFVIWLNVRRVPEKSLLNSVS